MTKTRFAAALALILATMTPLAVEAQFDADSRHGGFHLGMSGVGSTASIGLQGEVAFNDRVSIGGWVDTWSYGQSFGAMGSSISWDVRYFALAATSAYHFAIEDQPELDLFVGGSLGYFIVQSSSTSSTGTVYGGSGSRLFFGAHGGARYWFKENIAGLAQLGVGASYLTIGLDFSL